MPALFRWSVFFLFVLSLSIAVCERAVGNKPVEGANAPAIQKQSLVLLAQPGSKKIDEEIRTLQAKIKTAGAKRDALYVKLGWLFVEKARTENDPGFYLLANNAAECAEEIDPKNGADALLLRGHTANALHHFAEAEKIARELVTLREYVLDYALLGDALMEQGRLGDAVTAYQKMIDLKPCLETYCRVAHMRWLKGDPEGAVEIMREAVTAASSRNPEPVAWAYSRLALYELQLNDAVSANRDANHALEFLPGYAPALLVKGRAALAEERWKDGLPILRQAAASNPLPEYQWILADALRAADEPAEAGRVEADLFKKGATEDPRTFSLFLATRGVEPAKALSLAEAETKTRHDVFTLDALAWAQRGAGDLKSAAAASEEALAEGTQDARLLFHAAAIAQDTGNATRAREYFEKATALRQMLLPGERAELARMSGPGALTFMKTNQPKKEMNDD
jgi:tetratricopeptide (TPR) repeat protein